MATHDYLDKLDSVKIFGDKGNGEFGVLLDSLSLQPGVAFGPSFDIRESYFVFEYAVDTFAGQFIRNEAVVNYSVDDNKLTLGPRKTVYNSMNQVTTTRTASAPVNVPSNAIPVRQLLAAPYDYVGKNITVGPLKVLTNDISGRTVRSYQATGQNYDTDLSAPLEILYWQSPDENKWVNLPDFAIIYVKGTYYGTLMATELIRVK
ncbi:hypothetical protein SDC9_130358 [bioreactor metagenome]|uniref:Uncharacterized protein n=1 Tax=bioreactor metagenome TaxID=1076179 RepID=A0A645D1Y6_9ZZZZ